MFALGAIAAELFTLRPLFPGSSEQDELYKARRLPAAAATLRRAPRLRHAGTCHATWWCAESVAAVGGGGYAACRYAA